MKKSGFSLIELIFVIVILGILSAIAIPQLTATRDDATVVVAGQNINTAIQDIGTHYVAKGAFDANASQMSHFVTTANKWDSVESNATMTWDTCISLALSDGNVTVSYGTNTSTLCASVKDMVPANTYSFGGTGISY